MQSVFTLQRNDDQYGERLRMFLAQPTNDIHFILSIQLHQNMGEEFKSHTFFHKRLQLIHQPTCFRAASVTTQGGERDGIGFMVAISGLVGIFRKVKHWKLQNSYKKVTSGTYPLSHPTEN